MTESQSRFSIMEELNEKKLEAKRLLNELEQIREEQSTSQSKEIQNLELLMEQSENTYETVHKHWKAKKEMELESKRRKFEKIIIDLGDEIVDKDNTYKDDHYKIATLNQHKMQIMNESLTRFQSVQDKKVQDQKEELELIDSSIQDLKDISAQAEGKSK